MLNALHALLVITVIAGCVIPVLVFIKWWGTYLK